MTEVHYIIIPYRVPTKKETEEYRFDWVKLCDGKKDFNLIKNRQITFADINIPPTCETCLMLSWLNIFQPATETQVIALAGKEN